MAPETSSPGASGRVRTALGGLRRAFKRGGASAADVPAVPAVSVVVPFHNVERYIAECIESITSQTGPSLELILVDDGSTDASATIAEGYAQRDPRITLLSTPSLGPGGARNAGIRQARGQYLAFVDSDDRLAGGALATLVDAMEADQVDVVVAAVARFNSTRLWNPRWVGGIHDRPRHRITVEDFPEVIRNNYSWNKLYRRDYWMSQDLWFEDRVTFQDQPLVARMLWRADAITVLDTVVYEYRDRDDRTSISQRTEEFTNLRDRVAAWERTLAAIDADQVPDSVSEAWYRTLLQTHFHWYLSNESIADSAYWAMLREIYLTLRDRFPEVSLDSIHARQRLPLVLLERDDPSTLRQLVSDGGIGSLESEPAPGGSRLVPGDALRGLPQELLFTPLSALFVEATVVRAGWCTANQELAVEVDLGFVSPDRFEVPDGVELELRDLGGAVLVRTADGGWLTDDGSAGAFGLQHLIRFRVVLPAASPAGSFQLWLTVTSAGNRRHLPITRLLAAGGAPEMGSAASHGSSLEWRLLPGPHSHAPIRIVADKPSVSARAITITSDGLRLEVAADSVLDAVEFRSSEGRSMVVPASGTDRGTAVFTTVLPRLDHAAAGSWSVLAIESTGRKRGIRCLQGASTVGWPHGGDALVARPTTRGNLKLDAFANGVALATSVSDNGVLTAILPAEGAPDQAEEQFDVGELPSSDGILAAPRSGTGSTTVPIVAAPGLLRQLPFFTGTALTVARAKPRHLSLRSLDGTS